MKKGNNESKLGKKNGEWGRGQDQTYMIHISIHKKTGHSKGRQNEYEIRNETMEILMRKWLGKKERLEMGSMHFPHYNSGGHHRASKGREMRVVQTVDGGAVRCLAGPEYKMWIKRSNVELVRTHMEREREKKRQAKYVSKQVNVYIGDLVS